MSTHPVALVTGASSGIGTATTSRPRLRYPAGSVARQVTLLRRFAPATVFDKQIRKLNKLPAWAASACAVPVTKPGSVPGRRGVVGQRRVARSPDLMDAAAPP